jgi:hypothetical protein
MRPTNINQSKEVHRLNSYNLSIINENAADIIYYQQHFFEGDMSLAKIYI